MKKPIQVILTIAVFLSFGGLLNAQCPEGDVLINTSQDLSDFISTYPNCEVISGDLLIKGDESVTDIEALSGIKEVEGSLVLERNEALTSIEPLQLQWLGGNLIINRNEVLQNLRGLEGLTEIPGDLEYVFNYENFTSDGLENVKVLHGDLDVRVSRNIHLQW